MKDIKRFEKVKVVGVGNLDEAYFGEVCVVNQILDDGYLVWSRRVGKYIFLRLDEVIRWF